MFIISSLYDVASSCMSTFFYIWNLIPLLFTFFFIYKLWVLYQTTDMAFYKHSKIKNEKERRLVQALYEFVIIASNTLGTFQTMFKLGATIIVTKIGISLISRPRLNPVSSFPVFAALNAFKYAATAPLLPNVVGNSSTTNNNMRIDDVLPDGTVPTTAAAAATAAATAEPVHVPLISSVSGSGTGPGQEQEQEQERDHEQERDIASSELFSPPPPPPQQKTKRRTITRS